MGAAASATTDRPASGQALTFSPGAPVAQASRTERLQAAIAVACAPLLPPGGFGAELIGQIDLVDAMAAEIVRRTRGPAAAVALTQLLGECVAIRLERARG